MGRFQDPSASGRALSKADGQEGPVSWVGQTGSVLGTTWMCRRVLEGPIDWQWRGIEASRPPPVISAPLLQSGQVRLQPHVLCPRAEGLGEGLEGTQLLRVPEEQALVAALLLIPPMLPSLLTCSGFPGTLWLGSHPGPKAGWAESPTLRQWPWGCGEGFQWLPVPVTGVWETWDSEVLPDGCKTLGSVICWKWRVLRKLCQDQRRVYLRVTLTSSSVTCGAFSVSTCPDPSVRDSAGW